MTAYDSIGGYKVHLSPAFTVGAGTAASSIKFTGTSNPPDQKVGEGFYLTGTITSSLPIKKVVVRFVNANTNAVAATPAPQTVPLSAYAVDIRTQVDPYAWFAQLAAGRWKYELIATDSNGYSETFTSAAFNVTPIAVSSITFSGTSNPPNQMVGGSFFLTGTITSTYPIQQVVNAGTGAVATTPPPQTVPLSTCSVNIATQVDPWAWFASLPAGTWRYELEARDSQGNTNIFTSAAFTVSPQGSVVTMLPTDVSEYKAMEFISETNACVVTKIVKQSGSNITRSGIVLYNAAGSVLKDYWHAVTNVPASQTTFHSWYEFNEEVGYTLQPATTYRYKFHVTVNGSDYYSDEYHFTTGGTPKPSNAWINADKTSLYPGETITFTYGANNAAAYGLGIDRNGTRISTPSTGSTAAYSYVPTQPGSYSVYVTASNSTGSADSGRVAFTVKARPAVPKAPTVTVMDSAVTVYWNDVENETSYNVYLIQAPWTWSDIRYSKTVDANVTSTIFSGVADGDYRAFVIAMPNEITAQSPHTAFTIDAAERYTITYYPNGGVNAPEAQTVREGVETALSSARPLRTGYTFLGWARSAEAESAQYQPGESMTLFDNLDLYAVWQQDQSTQDFGTLKVASAEARPGESVTLSVDYENNPGVVVMAFALQYDHNALELTQVQDGSFTGWSYSGDNLLWIGSRDNTSTGNILNLVFRVKDDAEEGGYPVALLFGDGDVANYAEQAVTPAMTYGEVNVYHTIPGDLNGDGNVNTLDLVRLKRYLLGEQVQLVASGDLNGDGKINVLDLLRLEKFLLHEITSLTAGTAPVQVVDPETGLIVLPITSGSAYTPSSMKIITTSAQGKPGDVVEVPVRVESNPGVRIIRLRIEYDSERMSLEEIRDGLMTGWDFSGDALIWIGDSDCDADGVIMTMRFRIKADAESGESTAAVRFADGDILDSAEKSYMPAATSGVVTVSGDDYRINQAQAADGSVTVNLSRYADAAAKLYAAAYDADGGFLRAAIREIDLEMGDTANVTVALDTTDAATVKVFLLDASLKPLCDAAETQR